MFSHQDL